MRLLSKTFLVSCFFTLSGCATPSTLAPAGSSDAIKNEARLQSEMAITQKLTEEERINRLAYPLLKSSVDLCPDKAYTAGLYTWNKYSLGPKSKELAQQSFGLGESLQLRYVIENTPAAKAGLQKGDVLISVNGEALPNGTKASKKLKELMDEDKDASIDLVVTRAGMDRTVTLQRDYSCAYGVIYDAEKMDVNASANGENITIQRGMYRFANNDDELRLVIAHELGHNAMGHMDKREMNSAGAGVAGLALDVLAAAYGVNTKGAFTNSAMDLGGSAYSQAFENEADYVGMYILARGGYDTSNVANFWRRMATEYSTSSIKDGGDHPTTPERFLAIDNTNREIMNKIAAHEPLMPNMKEGEGTQTGERDL